MDGPIAAEILKRGHNNKQENYTKKIFMTQITMMVWLSEPRARHPGVHSPRARHPGVQSQVGLKKHHYEQRGWR